MGMTTPNAAVPGNGSVSHPTSGADGAGGQRVLVDSFGRVARDLRISITDRCNLRCRYCMPEEGVEWLDRKEILSYEELTRFVSICMGLGIATVRITGGEPTVRADLPKFIEEIAALSDDLDIALTTNGVTLESVAGRLADAGLSRVNISLDSLHEDRFEEITRRPVHGRVLAGLAAAKAAGLDPVKVNCVLMRGVNDDEIVDFAEFGRANGYEIRFIEFMPLEAGDEWVRNSVVPASEIIEKISARFPVSVANAGASDPATLYKYEDGGGAIGVIGSVTAPFCGTCDRIRITADGQFRTCLFATNEYDFRALLRSGVDDATIGDALIEAVAAKGPGHLIGRPEFIKPVRSMSRIGG